MLASRRRLEACILPGVRYASTWQRGRPPPRLHLLATNSDGERGTLLRLPINHTHQWGSSSQKWLSTNRNGAGGGERPEGKGEREEAEGREAEENGREKEMSALSAKVAELQEQLSDERKKVLYTLSEMENVRNIARRDAENARLFAVTSFAKSLLDVADNLQRALSAVPEEAKTQKGEESSHLARLLEGVEMTEGLLQKAFAANKLVRFGSVGDKFDPQLHDAMFEYEDASAEPRTVGQVLKAGYKLNDRVVRAASVGVVKKPS